MIKVTFPQKWAAMDESGLWFGYSLKPSRGIISWHGLRWAWIDVTGYKGSWRDSLHKLVNGKWEKVK